MELTNEENEWLQDLLKAHKNWVQGNKVDTSMCETITLKLKISRDFANSTNSEEKK